MEIKEGTKCTRADLEKIGCIIECIFNGGKKNMWSRRVKKKGSKRSQVFWFYFDDEEGIVRNYGPCHV